MAFPSLLVGALALASLTAAPAPRAPAPAPAPGDPAHDASRVVHREPLVVGEVVVLESALLGEPRPITVQVPPDVAADTALDVIVVLDAETHGYHVSGIVDFLADRYVERLPPTLVIGVLNTDRLRDTTPTPTEKYPDGGGARRFVRFLAEELLPWVAAEHATTGHVTLVGHSGSGLAALYALLDAPDSVDTVIAVDPSVGWDEGVFFEHAEEALSRRSAHAARLHLSTYREKDEFERLEKLLGKRAPRTLRWSARRYAGETHGSMVHRALLDALEAHGAEQLER